MNKLTSNIARISTVAGIAVYSLLSPALAHADKLIDCSKIKTGAFTNIACPPDGSTNSVSGIIGKAIILILVVSAILAFIFLIWGGLRYILSGGDKEGTAKARQTIIAAIIGLALVFLSFVIISVVGAILGVNIFQLDLETLRLSS